jgi:hypothetical protein
MNDELRTLRSRLERDMATLLAAELNLTHGGACYVVFASEVGLNGDTINVSGLSGPWFSQTWRGALEDRWKGHGPTVLLNDSEFLALSSDYPVQALVGGIGCHEFAHMVASKGWMSDYTATPPDVNRRETITKNLREPTYPKAYVPPGPTAGHDLAFCRVLFHMAARLQAMGWNIRRDLLGLPAWCGDPYLYAAVLDVEIEERWKLPLSAILHLPIPDGLLGIWIDLATRRAWDTVPAA